MHITRYAYGFDYVIYQVVQGTTKYYRVTKDIDEKRAYRIYSYDPETKKGRFLCNSIPCLSYRRALVFALKGH